MKKLFETITELLSQIPDLKWVDFDCGQLLEEKPPVPFPCALVTIDLLTCEDISSGVQRVYASFTVRLAFKAPGETHAAAPTPQRQLALSYFDIVEKVYFKMQGFKSQAFYSFSRTSIKNESLRKGLKTIAIDFSTAFDENSASS